MFGFRGDPPPLWDAYSFSKPDFMHSQRIDSSTVSTGLSTLSTARNGVFTRFPQELSTISTAYPQPLSTDPKGVDIHVDILFCTFLAVYKCDKLVFLCMFVHVLTHPTASFGRLSLRNPQRRKFSHRPKTANPQKKCSFPPFLAERCAMPE